MCSNRYTEKQICYNNGKKRMKKVAEMTYAYNKLKSGVDLVDKMVGTYSTKRKTYKWWKSVFYYVLDVCILNSPIIYFEQDYIKKQMINSRMLFFREKLIEEFCFFSALNQLHNFQNIVGK